jgi:hypothetical protein
MICHSSGWQAVSRSSGAAIVSPALPGDNQKWAHREAPKSFLLHVLFGLRKLLGVATFALIVVLVGPKLFVLFDKSKSAR